MFCYTNGYVYNTFEFYLHMGCKIEMYGYKLKKAKVVGNFDGENFLIDAQIYHAYESKYLENYKNTYKCNPYLSDNSDPNYKT